MNNERVDILIPFYEHPEFIEVSIRSAMAQTYRNIRIIVVDDGSSAGLAAELDKIAGTDERISVIHAPHGGISASRNRLLDASDAKYVTWLDSDDEFMPEFIERMMTALTEKDADIAICNYYNVTGKKKRLRYRGVNDEVFSGKEAVIRQTAQKVSMVLWGKLYRRELYEGVRFIEGTEFEDVRFSYIPLERAKKCAFINQPLMNRYNYKNSLSGTIILKKRLESTENYLRRLRDLSERYPEVEEIFYNNNWRMLLRTIRTAILKADRATYAQYSERLNAIIKVFAEHKSAALRGAGLPERIEYGLILKANKVSCGVAWIIWAFVSVIKKILKR